MILLLFQSPAAANAVFSEIEESVLRLGGLGIIGEVKMSRLLVLLIGFIESAYPGKAVMLPVYTHVFEIRD